MIFRHTLPKKADVFSQPTKPSSLEKSSHNDKSVFIFRLLGMITIVMLLSTLYSFITNTSPSTNLNDAPTVKAAENVAPQQGHHHSSHRSDNSDSNYNNDYSDGSYAAPSVYIAQPITWADYYVSPASNYNYQPGQNIGQISSQIVGTQQSIANQMQTCINNARSMANQIINLKNQQKQLQNRIDSMNQQDWDIDTSTDAGQQRRDAMDRQIKSLQDQSDALDQTINKAQDNYNSSNSNCQDNVDKLKQNRSDQESNLDDTFSKGMDIQIPY